MSNPSPGMRALEALAKEPLVFGMSGQMMIRLHLHADKSKLAAIIERETGCAELRELENQQRDPENAFLAYEQELSRERAQSEQLATALEEYERFFEGWCPMQCSCAQTVKPTQDIARAALAAYKERSAK